MSFLGLAAYLGVGLLSAEKPGGQLWQNIYAFLPPKFEKPKNEAPSDLGPSLEHDGLQYAARMCARRLKVAVATQKPLFLDFTGVNCVNCRLMEKGDAVRSPGARAVATFCAGAGLHRQSPLHRNKEKAKEIWSYNYKLQQSWFGDVTLPAYAVIAPDEASLLDPSKILSRTGGVVDVEAFTKFLDDGLAGWTKTAQATSRKPAQVTSSGPELPPLKLRPMCRVTTSTVMFSAVVWRCVQQNNRGHVTQPIRTSVRSRLPQAPGSDPLRVGCRSSP